jgi:hypothetical protein
MDFMHPHFCRGENPVNVSCTCGLDDLAAVLSGKPAGVHDLIKWLRKNATAQEALGIAYKNDFGAGLRQGAINIRDMLDNWEESLAAGAPTGSGPQTEEPPR